MPASSWPPARRPRCRPTRRAPGLSRRSDSLRERRRAAGARATEAPELLGVGRLVAGYGAEPVLHGIDLQVRQGEAVALLGANGAGKSTLMRALAGLHRPVRGGIHFDGADLATARRASRSSRSASCWCPRDGRCFRS